MNTRLRFIADTHAGARAGLVPPRYWSEDMGPLPRAMWEWYVATVAALPRARLCVHVGDMTDGEGKKGTVGLFETDVGKQAGIGAEVVREANAEEYRLVRGTPFHTDGATAYEDRVADLLGAPIADECYLSVHGVRIAVRHVVGKSGTPYGQETLLSKERHRDMLDALRTESQDARLIVRGHVHSYQYIEDARHAALIVPCFMWPGFDPYGRTQRAFSYDIGFVDVLIEDDGEIRVRKYLMPWTMTRREYEEIDGGGNVGPVGAAGGTVGQEAGSGAAGDVRDRA